MMMNYFLWPEIPAFFSPSMMLNYTVDYVCKLTIQLDHSISAGS